MRAIKKKFLTWLLVLSMVITGVASFVNIVNAANITDCSYLFNNTSASGQTSWVRKDNDSKVYVYPKSGPTIYYTVYGRRGGSSVLRCSNKVAIPTGVHANIITSVKENGCTEIQLRFERITAVNLYTKGVWCPNSERDGTIYE